MMDPMLSLAFSMHTNKGAYALLLGSGVSRQAGIPTGWEIVLDLARKLARLKGEECGPDPADWYRRTFDEAPDYDKLLAVLAKSPAERGQLLRAYFEQNLEEREQGVKVPTDAHKAIAQLVQAGHVRVIVTTNFDRLLETALREAGVVPTVISTPDAAEGALPLIHTRCTMLKVHGDYLDTRIKNTPGELAHYDERVNRLLDRIFDEFGLVICGWSAEWDTALRAALERCKTHRFTTYWAAREKPELVAQKLMELRHAQPLEILDADSFFVGLAEKLSALDELAEPHPLSARIAVATLKKYIAEDRHRVRLHDLLVKETENVYLLLGDEQFSAKGVAFSAVELAKRVQNYERITEILLALVICGCYWGGNSHEGLWMKCLQRIANPPGGREGTEDWIKLRLFPSLMLLFGAGIACAATGQYGALSSLLKKVKIRDIYGEHILTQGLHTSAVMEWDRQRTLPGVQDQKTPLSIHLFGVLREPFRELLADEKEYEDSFDRFEYLQALVHAQVKQRLGGGIWGPIGCFEWRQRIMKQIESEVAQMGANWPPLKDGLFDGSLEEFQQLKKRFDEVVRAANERWS